eukprot:NODE_210_length_2734_cov_36.289758_g193_i0.p1 GENE.NODE_210_length_2734_cov_36.289758_g193_i0~~NODE_210_length_2734_cov_36.289758_g193_i0.p1  ORF type:complete len:552 (+),score=117.21 NODE_210_length_2734_cov_36.289758_g193_i0:83-1657(+)
MQQTKIMAMSIIDYPAIEELLIEEKSARVECLRDQRLSFFRLKSQKPQRALPSPSTELAATVAQAVERAQRASRSATTEAIFAAEMVLDRLERESRNTTAEDEQLERVALAMTMDAAALYDEDDAESLLFDGVAPMPAATSPGALVAARAATVATPQPAASSEAESALEVMMNLAANADAGLEDVAVGAEWVLWHLSEMEDVNRFELLQREMASRDNLLKLFSSPSRVNLRSAMTTKSRELVERRRAEEAEIERVMLVARESVVRKRELEADERLFRAKIRHAELKAFRLLPESTRPASSKSVTSPKAVATTAAPEFLLGMARAAKIFSAEQGKRFTEDRWALRRTEAARRRYLAESYATSRSQLEREVRAAEHKLWNEWAVNKTETKALRVKEAFGWLENLERASMAVAFQSIVEAIGEVELLRAPGLHAPAPSYAAPSRTYLRKVVRTKRPAEDTKPSNNGRRMYAQRKIRGGAAGDGLPVGAAANALLLQKQRAVERTILLPPINSPFNVSQFMCMTAEVA